MLNERRLLATAAALALSFGAACAPDGQDEAETVTVTGAINPSANCFNTPKDITFRGSGKVLTPATYNHSTCLSSYLIYMDQYSPSNTLGTTAAYVGPAPTTQAACETTHMIAYVWRSNGTFLGSVDKKGAWVPDLRGVRHCRLPSVNLEQDTPGYKPLASWVIGLQARNDTAGTLQKISFATVAAGTPATLLDHLATVTSTLSGVAAGTVHPGVQAVFAKRGTPTGARYCRVAQLDKQIGALTRQSLIRVGASAQAATNRDTALSAIYTALCTSSGTAAGLQAAVLQYGQAQISLRDGMRFAASTLSTADQATVLVDVTSQALGSLVSRCGLKPQTVFSFLYDGTLPAGKTADNLLTGTCSGTLSQVVGTLGLGSNFPGDTLNLARNRFNKCLVDALGQNRCNDPRAAGAPDDNTNPAPPPDDAPKDCVVLDENRPCTEEEARGLSDEEVERAAAADRMNEQAAIDLLLTEQDKALGTAMATHLNLASNAGWSVAGTATLIGYKVAPTAPVALEVAAWAGAFAGLTGLASALCAEGPQTCGKFVRTATTPQPGMVFMQRCDDQGNCFYVQTSPPVGTQRHPYSGTNRMCAPDFATGGPGWFETDGLPGATRPVNQDDRINHCTCELLDGAYAGRNNGIAIAAGCPTPEDKFRQDCLTDPYQPRATPDPNAPVKEACLAGLSPPTNVNTRQTKICNAITCGSGQLRLTGDDGSCSCVSRIADTGQGLPCLNGLYAMCTDSDPANGSCGCIPTDVVPLGNDPLCQYAPDDTNWPGLLTGFAMVNRKDVFTTQFNATQQFAMLRPNRSMVGPTIYRNSLTAVPAASTSNPPALRVNTLLSKKPPAGGNIDLQIYVTSRGTPSGTQPLIHDFAGQVRLNNLATGTPTAVNIPLFAGANQQTMLNRAFSGKSLNIEYTVQGPSGYTRFVGVGSQALVGASTAIPVTGRAPFCPRPSPIATTTTPVLLPNPLFPNATPFSPGTLELSSGLSALLTSRIAVLRTLER